MNWPGAPPAPPMGGGAPPSDPRLGAWLMHRGVTPQFIGAYEHVKNMVWGPHPTPPFHPAQVDQAVAAWAHHAPPQQLQTMRDMGYLLLHFFYEQQVQAPQPGMAPPTPPPADLPMPGQLPSAETVSRMMSMAGGLANADFGSVVGIDGSEDLGEDDEEEDDEEEDDEEEDDEEEDDEDGEEEDDEVEENRFSMDGVDDEVEPDKPVLPPNRQVDPQSSNSELSIDWASTRPGGAAVPPPGANESAPLPQVAAASGLAIESGVRPKLHPESPAARMQAQAQARAHFSPTARNHEEAPKAGSSGRRGGVIAVVLVVVAVALVTLKFGGFLDSGGGDFHSDDPDEMAKALFEGAENQEAEEFLVSEDAVLFEWGYEADPMDFVSGAYDRGASDVVVADIEEVGSSRVAALFVITLPEDAAERETLVAWCDREFPELCEAGDSYIIAATD